MREGHDIPDDAWTELFASFPPAGTEEWLRQIRKDLGGASEEELTWQMPDGIGLRPFYRHDDAEALGDLHEMLGQVQGETPGWRIRQDIEQHDPRAANELGRAALQSGADELGFVLDSVGPEDTAIHSQDDFHTLLDGIGLAHTVLHLAAPRQGHLALALLLNEAERAGVDASSLKGSIEWDPLSDLFRNGRTALTGDLEHVVRCVEDVEKTGSPLRVLLADGRPFHEAGAAPVQELAYTLAVLSEYFARLTEMGLDAGRIAARTTLTAPVGTSFFVEIAKLRALRLLSARVIRAYAGGADVPALPLTGVTSRRSQSRLDPHTNLLRGTTAAMAAVLGGCDTVSVLPFNGAGQAPDATGYRLARNTQLILRHEAYLDRVADPTGGSYYVEVLTDAICREAWLLFQEIEARGGFLECLKTGHIQEQIGGSHDGRGKPPD